MESRAVVRPSMALAVALAALLMTAPALAGKARKEKPKEPPAPTPAAAPATPEALAAAAAASKLHPVKADAVYDGLAFGKDIEALTGYMRDRVQREVKPKILATPDVRQRDELQAAAEKEVEEFSLSHVEFRGQPTGWDVSILSGEFRHNARQEMRTWRERNTQAYFLVSEGTLWKLIQQQPSDERPFEEVLSQLRGAYGPPAAIETRTVYKDGEPSEVPERVTWTDGVFTVQAIDMSTLYHAHVVKWALTEVEQRVASTGPAAVGVDLKAQFRTEDILRDVTTPSDHSVDDIVDRLLDGTAPTPPPKPAPDPEP